MRLFLSLRCGYYTIDRTIFFHEENFSKPCTYLLDANIVVTDYTEVLYMKVIDMDYM